MSPAGRVLIQDLLIYLNIPMWDGLTNVPNLTIRIPISEFFSTPQGPWLGWGPQLRPYRIKGPGESKNPQIGFGIAGRTAKLPLFETMPCFRGRALTLLQTGNQTPVVEPYPNEATVARICRVRRLKQTASTGWIGWQSLTVYPTYTDATSMASSAKGGSTKWVPVTKSLPTSTLHFTPWTWYTQQRPSSTRFLLASHPVHLFRTLSACIPIQTYEELVARTSSSSQVLTDWLERWIASRISHSQIGGSNDLGLGRDNQTSARHIRQARTHGLEHPAQGFASAGQIHCPSRCTSLESFAVENSATAIACFTRPTVPFHQPWRQTKPRVRSLASKHGQKKV